MTKKILKRDLWDSTPFVLGEYVHKKNGKKAFAIKAKDERNDWEIDKGKVQPHPLFRIRQSVTEVGTGNYFFNKSLKDYELITEMETVK